MSDYRTLLKQHGQEHVLASWDTLSLSQQASLQAQIESLDFEAINVAQTFLSVHTGRNVAQATSPVRTDKNACATLSPAPVTELSYDERETCAQIGAEEIRRGRVGVILVAGGQGSRLGYDGPKGCYPVGPVRQTSLFFYHARKVLALERHFDTHVPLYIMTSPLNDSATRAFFEAHEYFGLSRDRVFFFPQAMWPALTPEGKIILDAPDHIFMSPDGHGGMLAALDRSGCLADMQQRGLSTLFYFQVDNPLVNVADPVFIGYHLQTNAEMSLKVCAKRDPDEGLGVVVESNGKKLMVEYTELTPEQKNERTPDGKLKFLYGSVAIHIFSLDFLVREAKAGLPLHVAHKKILPTLVGCKFEKFIFDCMADAKVVSCLAFDRAEEFSPIKNAEGADSPATCRRDLQLKWNQMLDSCGIAVVTDAEGMPLRPIEIDPCYAMDFDTLKARLIEHSKATDELILVAR